MWIISNFSRHQRTFTESPLLSNSYFKWSLIHFHKFVPSTFDFLCYFLTQILKSDDVIIRCSPFLVPNLRKWNFRRVINCTSIRQMITIPVFSSKMCHLKDFSTLDVFTLKIVTNMMKKMFDFPWKFSQHLAGASLVAYLIFWAEQKDVRRDGIRRCSESAHYSISALETISDYPKHFPGVSTDFSHLRPTNLSYKFN